MNRLVNLINEYYDDLINQIDISTEELLSESGQDERTNQANKTRFNFITTVKDAKIKSIESLKKKYADNQDLGEIDKSLVFDGNFCFIFRTRKKFNLPINLVLVLIDWYVTKERVQQLE